MTDNRAPKNGDFAAYLEGRVKTQLEPGAADAPESSTAPPTQSSLERLIEQQTFHPTEEDLLEQEADREEAKEIASWSKPAPGEDDGGITDEELARQALSHPGEDGDPGTPE